MGFCVWSFFVIQGLVSYLVMQSSWERAGCFTSMIFLLSSGLKFCGSFWRCLGLVCSVWLWYCLVMLTYLYYHCLQCLLRQYWSSEKELQYNLEVIISDPLINIMDQPQFMSYASKVNNCFIKKKFLKKQHQQHQNFCHWLCLRQSWIFVLPNCKWISFS